MNASILMVVLASGAGGVGGEPLESEARVTGIRVPALGVDVGINATTIYNDRGTNVFATGSQADQTLTLVPSLRYAFGASGVYLGYFGVFMVAGADAGDMARHGNNGEQHFQIGWGTSVFRDRLDVAVGYQTIVRPFQEAFATTILEPYASAMFHGPVDFGLSAAYSIHVQPEVAGDRHFYLRPSVGKSWALDESVALGTSFGVGYKFFEQPDLHPDRRLDAALQVNLAVDVGGWTVAPGANLGWLQIDDAPFEEGLMGWVSVAFNGTI